MTNKTALQRRIRFLLIFFIFALSAAGLTAIPLRWELTLLNQWFGTDWLAFAHIVIAAALIGPLRDPVRNIWVIEFGMIACGLIIPWRRMIFGVARDIPFFWTLIDISFGIFGIIPLWLVRRNILRLSEEL